MELAFPSHPFCSSISARLLRLKRMALPNRPLWKLYYWQGIGVAGRGEFPRMIFEDAGVAFEEVADNEKLVDVVNPDTDGTPIFALPAVEKPGGARLGQTGAICRMLGKQFGLAPDSQVDEGKADQVMLTCVDAFGDIGKFLFNNPDDAEAKEKFLAERAPKYMKHFEKVLFANRGGSGLFVVGLKATYADIGLFYVLRLLEDQYGPEKWGDVLGKYTLLSSYFKRMASRPQMQAYLRSDRPKPLSKKE